MDETVSQVFKRFAKEEFHRASPLYERLSLALAQDAELLALAAHCRQGERKPHLFFAAVHFLLLSGIAPPLARFYPSLGGAFDGRKDPFPDFHLFCREYSERIRQIIAVRFVQTNEVSRCAGLMPVIVTGAKYFDTRPLFLVDIGASAGLNLLWDQYWYKYGDELGAGDRSSGVLIECAARGQNNPPLPTSFPQVCGRVGVDLNPLDMHSDEDARWLRALIWPEHLKRAGLLNRAVEVMRQHSVKLIAGDGVERLAEVMKSVPNDALLCVTRIFTQLPQQSRGRWAELIAEYGAKRDLMVITARPRGGNDSTLVLTTFVSGHREERALAHMQNHGEWIEWLSDG
jgi:hypothetical protein